MLRILKHRDVYPPILITTSCSDAQIESAVLQSGAAAFVGKLIDSGRILSCRELIVFQLPTTISH